MTSGRIDTSPCTEVEQTRTSCSGRVQEPAAGNHPVPRLVRRFGISISAAPMLGLALVLLLGLALGGCGEVKAFERDAENKKAEDAEAQAEQEEKDRVPVEVEEIGRGEIEATLRFSTNLEAESSVEVYSQASRLVTELLVEEGLVVREGQVLLRLQDDEQKSSLARAESQLEKAQREYDRQKNLFTKSLISEQAMNDASYELEQQQLAVADAERELSYTEVRAPIGGTITQRLVNLGDNLKVGDHLFDIVDFDTIVARVFVPEKDMRRIEEGQIARLRSESIDGERRGEVIRIAPIVDPRSGTLKVTLGIPANQGLLPGQYVEAQLVVAEKDDALLVPKRSLVYDDTQVYLYRLREDRTVERVLVVPTLENRLFVEPAPSPAGEGLDVGDQVVVAGQAGLKEGTEVRLAEVNRDLEAGQTPEDSLGEAGDES
ncbi:MAG: efflux RND transporter periplasmic adaptor subunit [Holophagales bacterium]|nr:efflux RND transporter periplasmic adaptor subunit [Holophagales bacterium]